ncbi:MAG: hypothetical protein HYR49_01870 [Gammaproteobacteria bacterium]|nr:hypothetical protein [Gammaproteobacteria bacterium]
MTRIKVVSPRCVQPARINIRLLRGRGTWRSNSTVSINKNSLEIVRTLRPEPGRRAGHVEFTRAGRYA